MLCLDIVQLIYGHKGIINFKHLNFLPVPFLSFFFQNEKKTKKKKAGTYVSKQTFCLPSSKCRRLSRWRQDSRCWRSHREGQRTPHTCHDQLPALRCIARSLQTPSHQPIYRGRGRERGSGGGWKEGSQSRSEKELQFK